MILDKHWIPLKKRFWRIAWGLLKAIPLNEADALKHDKREIQATALLAFRYILQLILEASFVQPESNHDPYLSNIVVFVVPTRPRIGRCVRHNVGKPVIVAGDGTV